MPALIPCIMPRRGHGTGLYTAAMDRDRGRGNEHDGSTAAIAREWRTRAFAFSSVIIPWILADTYTEAQGGSDTVRRAGTVET